MIAQILLSTDFSPASWNAAKIGMEIARANKAILKILHVMPTKSKFSHGKHASLLPKAIEDVKHRMNDISSGMNGENGINVENIVIPGNIEDTMSEYIAENSLDLIIMGVNSNGVNNEIGSHTLNMIENSGVPILIVPTGTKP